MNRGNAVSFRFATAYGVSPRLRLDLLINDFTFKAVKDKTLIVYEKYFMRTFIHVRDMARSLIFMAQKYETKGIMVRLQYLLKELITEDSVLEFLSVAHEFGLEKLINDCHNFIFVSGQLCHSATCSTLEMDPCPDLLTRCATHQVC